MMTNKTSGRIKTILLTEYCEKFGITDIKGLVVCKIFKSFSDQKHDTVVYGSIVEEVEPGEYTFIDEINKINEAYWIDNRNDLDFDGLQKCTKWNKSELYVLIFEYIDTAHMSYVINNVLTKGCFSPYSDASYFIKLAKVNSNAYYDIARQKAVNDPFGFVDLILHDDGDWFEGDGDAFGLKGKYYKWIDKTEHSFKEVSYEEYLIKGVKVAGVPNPTMEEMADMERMEAVRDQTIKQVMDDHVMEAINSWPVDSSSGMSGIKYDVLEAIKKRGGFVDSVDIKELCKKFWWNMYQMQNHHQLTKDIDILFEEEWSKLPTQIPNYITNVTLSQLIDAIHKTWLAPNGGNAKGYDEWKEQILSKLSGVKENNLLLITKDAYKESLWQLYKETKEFHPSLEMSYRSKFDEWYEDHKKKNFLNFD